MKIDLSELSTPDLKQLIEDAGIEFAKRNEPGPPEPPESRPYTFAAPFGGGVDDGKFTLSIRSAFYGWVTFQWSLEATQIMQGLISKAIDVGVAPSSAFVTGVAGKTWSVH